MYEHMTKTQLDDDLANVNRRIDELRSYGASWALDCREMRILEANQLQIWNELLKKQRDPSS